MSTTIELADTRVKYFSIAEARGMSGLRLVLGNYAIAGPWREACKSIFQVKGIAFTPVVTGNAGAPDSAMGMHDTQSELREWTGQASQPVAVWNEERPRASWIDQLNLAERLATTPRLIPSDIQARVLMFGLINELAGEYGLSWLKRVLTVHAKMSQAECPPDTRKFFAFMGDKYGYTSAWGATAPGRIATILKTLDIQLAAQQSAGRQYLNRRGIIRLGYSLGGALRISQSAAAGTVPDGKRISASRHLRQCRSTDCRGLIARAAGPSGFHLPATPGTAGGVLNVAQNSRMKRQPPASS